MLGEGKYAVDVDLLQLCGIPLDLRESQSSRSFAMWLSWVRRSMEP